MSDMNTMPIPELVEAIRSKAESLGNSDMIIRLVLGVLANRLEQTFELFKQESKENEYLRFIVEDTGLDADEAIENHVKNMEEI